LTVPPSAIYGLLELRSELPGDTLLWEVMLPPALTQVVFVTLPQPAESPLKPGRTYTLTVSAFFANEAIAGSLPPYRDFTPYVQSIGDVERGVTQVTRRSIQITTN